MTNPSNTTATGAASAGATGAGATTALRSSILPTYGRYDLTLVRGDGSRVWDDTGKCYLDCVAGIAVIGLGHCNPVVRAAAEAQLGKLWHVSNLYWTEPMLELARKLSDRFGGSGAQAFFCNSGAESIEAALKYARKATGKPGFVALEGSFHGRTFGALSVTGQPAKRAAFEPGVPGASFVPLNDTDALGQAVGHDTGCILLEPIQGEGGVNPVTQEFMEAAREIATARGALLILDEIQTGTGRTGSFFAWEQLDVRPDALTLAKGLANGLPIGALLVANDALRGFEPGDHASTFGGNPVAAAAACAVLDLIDDALLAHVSAVGERLSTGLRAIPQVSEVRGRGLLLAAEIDRPGSDAVIACMQRGLLLGTAGPTALRITPPLTLTADDADEAVRLLAEALA